MQGTRYDIVTYLDLDDIYDRLNSIDTVYAWALCTHDKPEDLVHEDGTFKKVHTHIVLILEDKIRMRGSRLVRLFNTTELRKIVTSQQLIGSFEYLTHESKKAVLEKKVKYEKSKLQFFNEEWFYNLETFKSTNSTLDIIDAINSGCSHRELVAMFGRDFVINYKAYCFMAEKIYKEERSNKLHLIQGDFDYEN